MKKPGDYGSAGMKRKSSQSSRGAGRNAEKIDKYTFREQRVVIGQDANGATGGQHLQHRPSRLVLLDGRVPTEAAVTGNQGIDARVVEGAHQKMERVAKQCLGEGREFPRAHVPGQEENSFAACLRRREIFKSIEQDEALDILFRKARKVGELRPHPAKLPHHATQRRPALLLAPFGKCQTQILHCGAVQSRPRPEQKCGRARSGISRERPRQRANRLQQDPQRCVFQSFSHPGIIAVAGSTITLNVYPEPSTRRASCEVRSPRARGSRGSAPCC